MKKVYLLILLLSAAPFYGRSQTTEIIDPPKKTVHGSSRSASFGEHPSAVADYLSSRNVLAGETIVFKRAVFQLQIDHEGNVKAASLFYGSITPATEERIKAALLAMPAWKSTLKAGQSTVHLVVLVKEQVITTEIY